ncbi:hypothetical protein D3C76_1057010 [compost metagenome]
MPAQQAIDVLVAHAFAAGGQGAGLVAGALGLMAGVDVPVIRVGLGDVAVDAVAEGVGERAVEAEAHALGGAFVTVLGKVLVNGHVAVGFARGLLGDDVDHPAHGPGAIAGRGRATDHFDALDLVGRHPVGITARVALASPAVAHRTAAADRLAIDQDQGVFRAHAADVDLPVVAALATGGVAGQVDSRHGADDLRQVVGRRAFLDVLGGDDRHARRLLGFFQCSGHHVLAFQLDGRRLVGGGLHGAAQQAAGQQQEGGERKRAGRHHRSPEQRAEGKRSWMIITLN